MLDLKKTVSLPTVELTRLPSKTVNQTSTTAGHDDIEMEPNVQSNTLPPETVVTEYGEPVYGSSAPRAVRNRKRTKHPGSGTFI